MAVSGKKVILFTADGDILDTQLKRLKLVGCRLVAGSAADATATLRVDSSSGEVIYALAAAQKTADDTAISSIVESGKIHVSLSGTGAQVLLYLE